MFKSKTSRTSHYDDLHSALDRKQSITRNRSGSKIYRKLTKGMEVYQYKVMTEAFSWTDAPLLLPKNKKPKETRPIPNMNVR